MAKTKQDPPPVEQPFVQHLIELRDRLMRVVLVVVVVFLALFAFANDIYTYLADPLMRHLPEGASMIATEVASPFLTPFKLTLVLSIFIAVPVILYQFWGFIAPGLYKKERRLIYPLMLSSTLLFFLGMAFAYYVVFPLVFGFLIGIAPEGVSVMTDITKYLDFVLKMFFAFGLAFEVPIATILVVWSGMTTAEELGKKRPYIIVGAFVFGMLLTPPDVISQTLLALPMWVLFELGLILSRWYTKPEEDDEEEEEEPLDELKATGTTAKTTAAGATAFTMGGAEADENNPASDSPKADVLTDAEMDAVLDQMEAEEAAEETQPTVDPVDPVETVETVEEIQPTVDPTATAEENPDQLAPFDDGVDEEEHAKATAEAEAFARAAAGDVSGNKIRIDEVEEDEQVVFTDEDHDRITAEAMALAKAAAGIPEPESASDETTEDTAAAETGDSGEDDTAKSDPDAPAKTPDGAK